MSKQAKPPDTFTPEERSRGGHGAQRAMAENGTRRRWTQEEIERGAKAGGAATRAKWERWRKQTANAETTKERT